MTILIHDTTLITVDHANNVMHGAAIAIDGGRIAAIGRGQPQAHADGGGFARTIGADNGSELAFFNVKADAV